jgi:hypothetical protein
MQRLKNPTEATTNKKLPANAYDAVSHTVGQDRSGWAESVASKLSSLLLLRNGWDEEWIEGENEGTRQLETNHVLLQLQGDISEPYI